jgi:transcriptional regulator with XRE-family HTH domain
MNEIVELPSAEPKETGACNRIKELRKKAGLNQRELGKLIGKNGFIVSRHERGSQMVAHETILRYATVLKVYTYELFFRPVRRGEDGWSDDTDIPAKKEHDWT